MGTDTLTIGQTKFRDDERLFGIELPDRLTHLYILGQTGTGKTTLLEFMLRQDIAAGRGCAVLDPHGDLSQSLATYAKSINKPVIVLDIADATCPYGYNPIRRVSQHLRPLLASGLLEVFKKLWADAWGVRMEHIFRNVLLTLLDQPKGNLADVPRILTDKTYRDRACRYISNEHVKNFWIREFKKYSKRYINDMISPIMNKVGGFLTHPVVAKFLTDAEQEISLRQIMDSGQVLIINLSKGELGEEESNLVGSLMMTSIGLAAFSRADTPEVERKPFFLYADEFQNFTTLSLVNMASELRKYGLSIVAANQYTLQLSPEIRAAIIGNFGSLLCFRVGADDAVFMEKEFYPVFDKYDLMNLPNYHLYVKLMHKGKPSKPFSAISLPLTTTID